MLSQKLMDDLEDYFVMRQEKINLEVLTKIARDIKEIGEAKPSDLYTIERLYKSGASVKQIEKYLAKATKLQQKEIDKILTKVATEAYHDTEKYYRMKKVPFIPFLKNKELQDTIAAIKMQTKGKYQNIVNALAFMIRDPKNRKRAIPTSISKTYYTVIDKAIQAVKLGITDFHSAMRSAINELIDSGIRTVDYEAESGRRTAQRVENAARRNILDGIRQTNMGVQEVTGQQFGANGKEITVHAFSAPDHEPIQGHQFTDEEFDKLQNGEDFQDYQGRKFKGIPRKIGIWNCRHSIFVVVLPSKPMYTDEQLEKFKEDNAKGYTDSKGRHRTMYECTQEQRKLERDIRAWKSRRQILEESGDKEGAKQCTAKIKEKIKQYQEFSKACGLAPKFDRIRIPSE